MNARFWLGAAIGLVLCAFDFQLAVAHTKSESHTDWRIAGNIVHLTFTIPEVEAKRLSAADSMPLSNDEISAYLAIHVGAASQETICEHSVSPRAIAAAAGFRRFEFTFHCPDSRAIKLQSSAFFDVVPSHVTFAQITTEDGKIVEQLISKDHQILEIASDGNENRLQSASFFEYVRLGIAHILTGPDHISFLLGLVLISRTLRDLIFVVTGFTLGHSITLALAVTGIIRPHAEFIDALVGLTIILIGAENIAFASRRPGIVALGVTTLLLAMALASLVGLGGLPPLLLIGAGLFAVNYLVMSGHLQDAARLRLVVTLVFGLIHGFGFAADLLEMRLPAARLAELLVGFNLGVELGQLTLVFLMMLITAVLVRLGLALPRPVFVDLAASTLVAFGCFLLINRAHS
jgi:hypothetical protein